MAEFESKLPVSGGKNNVFEACHHVVKALRASDNNLDANTRKLLSDLESHLSMFGIADTVFEDTGFSEIQERFKEAAKTIQSWETNNSLILEASPSEADDFFQALYEVQTVVMGLKAFPIKSNKEKDIYNQATVALDIAMLRLEKELCDVLHLHKQHVKSEYLAVNSCRKDIVYDESFVSLDDEVVAESSPHEDDEQILELNTSDSVDPRVLPHTKAIANAMFACDYDQAFCGSFISVQREALNEYMVTLEMERFSCVDVLKMKWEDLDGAMRKWTRVVKIIMQVYLTNEKQLCEHILGDFESISSACFIQISKETVLSLLNFGEAVTLRSCKPEMLERFLSMYDVSAEILLDVDNLFPGETGLFLRIAFHELYNSLANHTTATFLKFKDALASDESARPFPGGGIHHLKLLPEYTDTLNSLLQNINVDDLIHEKTGQDVEVLFGHLGPTPTCEARCINQLQSSFNSLALTSGMTVMEECILVFSCNSNLDVDETCFIESISNELQKREITPLTYNLLGKENLEMLKRCRVGIMILSEGYAFTQYLDHLMKIMEHKKAANLEIIPIYFKAALSDICGLEGGFEPMYLQYMESTQPDRVQKWKETMAEIVSVDGHEWTKEKQVLLTEEVVRNACLRLCLKNSKNVVSILAFLHHSKPSEAEIVGLWGMAGIGKTSIAREIFGVLSPQYDICYFLQDFYLMCQEKGLRQMRDDFLSKVFREDNLSISACDIRPSFMKDLFQNKTILIVLDDVVDARDVEAIVGGFGWFSHGHRIILTSRQKQVLVQCKVKEPYEIKRLYETESFRLCKQYLDGESVVISELISCSSGIPLALEVLGSSVSKQDRNNMKEHLQGLRKNPPTQIQEAFHKSFDRLDKDAKNIFLDIACFFAEENKEYVVELLDACGFLTYLGICDLIDESLISLLDDNRIEIPIPFRDIGRFIVHEEADDPCERSRLWDSSDIADILTKNSGTEAIEAIFMDTSDKACELKNPDVFGQMHNLRLLKFYGSTSGKECKLSLPQGLDTLPDELRLLHWEHYPLKHLPQNFIPENLVELNMPYSKMEKLWEGKKNLKMLKKIKLSHSTRLTDIQVLSEAMNLELIDFEGCTSLVDISTSIPPCGKLVSLNMKDCSHLRSLPAMVDLISLKLLNLSGCKDLKEIQDIAPNLEELYLAGTTITELPLSIKNLTKLVILDLENCRRLRKLPSEIRNSRSIVELKLFGCINLAKLKVLDCGTSKC